MKKNHVFTLAIIAALFQCCSEKVHVSDYVSTLVGTQSDFQFSTGNLYPATTLPWGMNCWTPMTGRLGDGWAYSYNAHMITGFKQTHQPSPWINDYGYYAIMPLRDTVNAPEGRRASWFSHKSETARPYYYQVYLADHDINAEIAPTERGAQLRFTFPESGTSGVVIDAADPDAELTVIPEANEITGFTTNNHGGVPENFHNWFIIKFDKAFESWSLNGDELTVSFRTARGEQVGIRTASSFISPEQARINLRETEGSFEDIKSAAQKRWDEVLGRIEISGGSPEQLRTFYSCLFRSTLFPRKFHEIDEQGNKVHYSPYNGEVRPGALYTDSGFWDVFRAQMPLINLVYPSVGAEIFEGLVHIAEENPFLPEWASPGHRNCMVGQNSASVVADAYVKGIASDGIEKLYEALVHGAHNTHPEVPSAGRLGHEYYDSLGYIPYNAGIKENTARTLEYAYDDYCIGLVAEKMGKNADEVKYWMDRSGNWRNVFDKASLLMRGRNLDGSFQEPFSPYKWGDAFTEGNAWHYTWSVFHDVEGLAQEMGGHAAMEKMLDSVFVVPPVYDDSYYGFRIHEITEMQVADMGNYAHGNQPAQHMIYLYDYIGRPDKCRSHVREVMERLYSCTPDGYCGDEDNGQTSAWYIFSALGFYPVCPVSGEYALGEPLFSKAVIHHENGRDIVISSGMTNDRDPFISYEKLVWGR